MTDDPQSQERDALVARATKLLGLVRKQARRAFVVELAGTPKAGKSTSVATIKQFFEQCGFSVHLLRERAADCPLPMKGHFFFNTWTMCSMLAEVLATVDTETDLLILDRGVFDALMWLELQSRRGQVTEEEKDIFSKFVTLDRWRRLVDLTFVVKVDPEVAMARENSTRIIPKQGSLMNPTALAEINDVLDAVSGEFANNFTLREFETTNGSVIPSNIRLVGMLLDAFESWADQEILAVPRSKLMELRVDAAEAGARLLDKAAATKALDQLVPSLILRKRSALETDNEYVQLVSCGFLQDKDGRFFVLKRAEKDDKVRAHGRFTLWKGCHLESKVNPGDTNELLTVAIEAVKRRVAEEFHLAVPLAPAFWGIAWDEAENHAALMFDVRVASPEAIRHMGQKEFKRQGRFQPHKGSSFRSAEEILKVPALADRSGLEPWSRARLSGSTA